MKAAQVSSKNKARPLKPKGNLTSLDFYKLPETPNPVENEKKAEF